MLLDLIDFSPKGHLVVNLLAHLSISLLGLKSKVKDRDNYHAVGTVVAEEVSSSQIIETGKPTCGPEIDTASITPVAAVGPLCTPCH